MHIVSVVFEIAPDQISAFLPLMMENAQTSVRDEPGCHQFDVGQNPDQPDKIFLYEVYENQAAFQDHLHSAHFKAFDAATREMILDKTVSTYEKLT